MKRDTTSSPIIASYVMVIAVCLFVWPVVVGFEGIMARFIWIAIALVSTEISILYLMKSKTELLPHAEKSFPWLTAVCVTGATLIPALSLPITFFGDEPIVAIPALTVLWNVAAVLSWPLLTALFLVECGCFLWSIKKMPLRILPAIPILCAIAAIFVAIALPQTATLATRYPPLVHFMQSIGTLFTWGRVEGIRFSNGIWTLLLALALWHLTPKWNVWSKIAAFFGILLTPLGWTYRILLYQTCGELTLGIAAILLLSLMIQSDKKETYAAYLGMVLSLWILYRPTAIAVACVAIGIALIAKKTRSACIVAGITLPIAVTWISVYVLGAFHYDFLSPSARTISVDAVVRPMREAGLMLIAELHPIGFFLLILGSVIVFLRCDNTIRMPLMIAWIFGLTNTAVHNILTTPQWYGYGRFNAMMLLPFSMVLAGIASQKCSGKRLHSIAAIAVLAVLAAVTPWKISLFLQEMRTVPLNIIERTVSGGVMATKLPQVVKDEIRKTKDLIILQPDAAYLDVLIAANFLTPDERTRIIQSSRDWTPDSQARPVIIQAPSGTITYQKNIDAEEEKRLLDAALWARSQPNVEEVWYENEVVLIVR